MAVRFMRTFGLPRVVWTRLCVRCCRSSAYRLTRVWLLSCRPYTNSAGKQFVGDSALDQIVKLDLLKQESRERITEIWLKHHQNKPDFLSAVVPAETFQKIRSRAESCPMFVLPIVRDGGMLSVLMQVNANRWLFSPLAEYSQGNLTPQLIVTFYPELQDSKGIVLMRGSLAHSSVPLSNIPRLSVEEAQMLVNWAQLYYLDDSRYALVTTFNKQPDKFNFDTVLADVGVLSKKQETPDAKPSST